LHTSRFAMNRLGEKSYIDQDSLGDKIYDAMRDVGEVKLFPWFLQAELDSRLKDMRAQIFAVPSWVDWELIELGQSMRRVCNKHAHELSLTFTLLGGFSVPELNEILISSRYWVDKGIKGRKDTFRRLEETRCWYECIMQDSLKPGGKAWKEVLEVRMLHSKVRFNLKKSYGTDRVPINQLHLLATLSGFQYNYLKFGEEQLGMTFERKELEAWTMLWRWVGYCIGIQEKALKHFSSFEASEIWWQSVVKGLLLPDKSTKELTDHIITTLAENLTLVKRLPKGRQIMESAYRVMLPPKMADCLHYDGSIIGEFICKVAIYNLGCVLSLERYLRKLQLRYKIIGMCVIFCRRFVRMICLALVSIRWTLASAYGKIKNFGFEQEKEETVKISGL